MNFINIKYPISVILLLFSMFVAAQVGINTETPNPDTDLELASPDKVLLLNRVASTDLIENPVSGMILYDISANCVKIYQETRWFCIESAPDGNNAGKSSEQSGLTPQNLNSAAGQVPQQNNPE